MNRKLCTTLFVSALAARAAGPALAQQQTQHSQYMNNNYLLNPAVAGTEDYIDAKFSSRLQWTGLEGSPNTYYASVHSSLGKWRTQPKRTLHDRHRGFHALGGIAYNDVTGPTSRAGLYGSYAYNLALTPTVRLALGASVGMQQFAIDGEKLRFHDPNNHPGNQASRMLDGTVGVWLYSPSYYVGISGAQLFANALDFSYAQTTPVGAANALQRHYFGTVGGRVPLGADWALVPSVLVKVVSAAPVSVDFSAKLRYRDSFWVGASVRPSDSVVALFGVNFAEYASLGYSYDTGISQLAAYHWGSHEVVLGLKLKKTPKVVCTDRFW